MAIILEFCRPEDSPPQANAQSVAEGKRGMAEVIIFRRVITALRTAATN